ncbi:glycoside hydrolase family 5 protein [Streptomyces caatingaensis]|uniref:Endoglycoceramidase n=1 Tax=Streptomyces caatingaensis TaxID=1678637 RepID=A0A0K9XFR6_9ACTN|nr:cellulase family glycosylhydrolase [Streptomyces caatingaensis]KNB51926.1 endoglycoceramidase [Streptomyces caatingaensis]
MRTRRLWGAGLVLALTLLLPSPAAAVPGDGIPPLTDEHGRALTLRGWNLADKEHRGDAALSAITERDLRDMAGHGFDFARLAVFWDDLEPRPGRYSERYLRKVERVLDWAARYRIRVVIDAHQDVYGPAFGGHRGIPEWATRTDGLPWRPHPGDWFAEYFEPGVQAAFEHLYEDPDLRRAQERMWAVLAGRLGRHPAVFGYDLINEPMGRMRPGEHLPDAARRVESTQVTPMYDRLAAAIRSADGDRRHWLFVEPTPVVGEGVPTALGRIHDPAGKVVYAPHFYNSAMETGADYDPSAGWVAAYEAAVVRYPRERQVPVVVGEWGPPDSSLPGMARYYADALRSLGRYGSGWAGWEWCYGGGYCAVDEGGRFRPNKERTVGGYAVAVAGAVRGLSYDEGRFRLEYVTGGTGVTEVSVGRGRLEVAGPVVVRSGERGRVFLRALRAGALVRVTVTGPSGTR